jgi:REP element-mobilizing transposase RayT
MSRQRGTRRERAFFGENDTALYRDLLASRCHKHGVAVFCLLPMANHAHLILVPDREQVLGRAHGERHRRYSSTIIARVTVTGHCCELPSLAHRIGQKTAGICLNLNEFASRLPLCNPRILPKTAFSRLALVHRNDVEGRLRVDSGCLTGR